MDEHDRAHLQRLTDTEETRRRERQADLMEEIERRRNWTSDQLESRILDWPAKEAEWRRERTRDNWAFLFVIIILGVLVYVLFKHLG